MKNQNMPAPPRQEIPVINADPEQGLTAAQAAQRLAGGWSNRAPDSAARTEKDIIRENCLTFFNLVFLVLAVVLLIGGSSPKNLTFLVVVVCNTLIGCYQEIRAKRAVERLTLVSARRVRVLRDGEIYLLAQEKLVRDDIAELAAGDAICADGIVRAGEIQVNESLVTGEQDPIRKQPGDSVRSGSFVVSGSCRFQLTKVGGDAFAARLAAEAKADPHAAKSEMMRSLDRVIYFVGAALVPVGLLLFYQEYHVLAQSMQESVEATVSALVGMIPEGLYLLTSIAMAASSLKLSRQKVLVQDMNCIETLARVDVLCVDKTGTITEARMETDDVIPLSGDPPERLEQILAAFYAGTEPENDTARAMAETFSQPSDWECVRRVPFSSQTKWSAAVFRNQGAFVIGAPEPTLGSRYDEVKQTVEECAAGGLRVLLVAQYDGELGETLEPERLSPLALVLLTNRIRPDAQDTFAYFARQGVSIKVISGDNPLTVSEVARRAGIAGAEHYIDASQLQTEEDYRQAVKKYTVFGRVTPDQKKRLVQALKKRGHTVAMVGDGVNDVLAMKESDCGIAMAGGAQAASQLAQIVLLKSDFASMPQIVDEGRRVINNIQRAATLFLVKNIFSLGLSVITLFTSWHYPFIPLHLTVISGLTIGIPSFFLAMEPNYDRVEGRFLPSVLRKAFPGGLTNIFVVLMAQAFGDVFSLSSDDISTACTALLGVVGLLVLYQTCKPLNGFRKAVWGTMAAALIFCFTALSSFFELHSSSVEGRLVMLTLLIMTPTVFFTIQQIFDWCHKWYLRLRSRFRRGKTAQPSPPEVDQC